jgi:signal transduction histidine kinase
MMDDVQAQNEQLETVSHVLSHDLRNPLNVALGRAELLGSDVESPHTDPLVDSLDRIDTIIDDALVLALHNRVEETRPVTLWDAVQRAWGHVETGDARLELDGDVGFEADATLLGHVFENLFRNSVEHAAGPARSATRGTGEDDETPDNHPVDSGADVDDPSVTIRVGPLDADGTGGSANAGIVDGFYVEDDGPGIPATERDRVFETGFTTNRTGGGTGFGLAIVAKVVDAHGWEIRVTEGDSGGARFEIRELTDTRINESMSESLA